MFKIYLGRNEDRVLKPDQIAGMDALQEQLLARPGFSRRYSDWRAGHRAILAAEAG